MALSLGLEMTHYYFACNCEKYIKSLLECSGSRYSSCFPLLASGSGIHRKYTTSKWNN